MSIQKITSISGKAVPLRGDNIDTDRIIPARYLRCVTFDGLGEHAFEDDILQDPAHPFKQDKYRGATILFAGRNFGCGSSREHAPQSLAKWGIQAIVAESFAEIFFGNCTNMGIPCLRASGEDCARLQDVAEQKPETVFSLDVAQARITADGIAVQGEIPSGVANALLSGEWNATAVLLQAEKQIEAMADSLPYRHDFLALDL